MTHAQRTPAPLFPDLELRVLPHMREIDAAQWDGLLAQQAQPTPFMRHAYLLAMEESGSATPETGAPYATRSFTDCPSASGTS